MIIGSNNRLYLADNANVKYGSLPTLASFTNIGTVAGGDVYDMAIDRSGDLYVVGSFTGINGVANTSKIAKYDISAGTWGSVSSDPPVPCRGLFFGLGDGLGIAIRHVLNRRASSTAAKKRYAPDYKYTASSHLC
jgi:hypothetical protein